MTMWTDDRWCGPYLPEVLKSQFEKLAEGWNPGIEELRAAVQKTPRSRRAAVEGDLRYARAAAINFQSVANQTRFSCPSCSFEVVKCASDQERRRLRAEIKRLLQSEIVLARRLFTLTWKDSRIGFESSCHYFYLPLDLVEKVINCRWLLEYSRE